MFQVATYWEPAFNTGFGDVTFNPPILIQVRWQNKLDLIRGTQGQEIPSTAIVYSEVPLKNSGYIALGNLIDDYANPKDFPDAKQIIQVENSPKLDNAFSLNKNYL